MLALVLTVSLSKLPEAVAVEAISEGMISTADAVDLLSRAEVESKIRAHLGNEDLQRELTKLGVTAEEASKRLATLSRAELDQLAKQMDEAKYGGITGLLVIALLVVLIIYFAKRI